MYQGRGLYLYVWNGSEAPPQKHELSAANEMFCYAVPAGAWQAAEPIGDRVLVGCTVGPGFEFQDFELIDPSSRTADAIKKSNQGMARFIED